MLACPIKANQATTRRARRALSPTARAPRMRAQSVPQKSGSCIVLLYLDSHLAVFREGRGRRRPRAHLERGRGRALHLVPRRRTFSAFLLISPRCYRAAGGTSPADVNHAKLRSSDANAGTCKRAAGRAHGDRSPPPLPAAPLQPTGTAVCVIDSWGLGAAALLIK